MQVPHCLQACTKNLSSMEGVVCKTPNTRLRVMLNFTLNVLLICFMTGSTTHGRLELSKCKARLACSHAKEAIHFPSIFNLWLLPFITCNYTRFRTFTHQFIVSNPPKQPLMQYKRQELEHSLRSLCKAWTEDVDDANSHTLGNKLGSTYELALNHCPKCNLDSNCMWRSC